MAAVPRFGIVAIVSQRESGVIFAYVYLGFRVCETRLHKRCGADAPSILHVLRVVPQIVAGLTEDINDPCTGTQTT